METSLLFNKVYGCLLGGAIGDAMGGPVEHWTPEHIRALILGQGAALAGAGLVLGIGLALLGGRVLRRFLFEVSAADPLVLSTVVIGVALATLAACYVPVRRAIRVDPMVALRAE